MMKASGWDDLTVKCLVLYLKIQMESHLVLMLDYIWDLGTDPLMVLMIASLRAYCFKVHWDILMAKCFSLMKASHWDDLVVK